MWEVAFIDMLSTLLLTVAQDPSGGLARTPPMGWMSWQAFRCETDCAVHPSSCINEQLYKTTADALNEGGFVDAGYTGVHIDDCWEGTTPPRDSAGKLYADAGRFPSGMTALSRYLKSKGASLGIYSDEGTKTCGGYPGSKGYEAIDAQTFQEWEVDYLKLDGCYNSKEDYPQGYAAFGKALRALSRPIVYSCSWPAYLGDDETKKPFGDMTAAGCNLWRNWADIQCSWGSLSGIIEHWGTYSDVLQKVARPGHWNDPDMLLIGATKGDGSPCVSAAEVCTSIRRHSCRQLRRHSCRHFAPASPLSPPHHDRPAAANCRRPPAARPAAAPPPPHDLSRARPRLPSRSQERTQMAIWAITASPLIMGNDARNLSAVSATLLLNERAIAIDQDALGVPGKRLVGGAQQVWSRPLGCEGAGCDVAVALYNFGGQAPPPIPTGPCDTWTHTQGQYATLNADECRWMPMGADWVPLGAAGCQCALRCHLFPACLGSSALLHLHDLRLSTAHPRRHLLTSTALLPHLGPQPTGTTTRAAAARATWAPSRT